MLGRTVLINKLVAKDLGIDEKRVNNVMGFFYKELEKELVDCNHPFLYVKGLGTFGIALGSVERRILKLRKKINEQRKQEAKGIVYKYRQKMIDGMAREIFFLFGVRRMVKKQVADNKKLRDYGKSLNDNQGKLVQADGEE